MARLLFAVVLLSVAAYVAADNYAVLVAGSNGFWNYRHQADVCHAYQVVRSHGIPAENVIVMMYDDIASSPSNPFPGQLFNRPADSQADAHDVYKGVAIDYSGADVTPENFVAVLTGDKAGVSGGNGRVLESGPHDHVFVNFVDHGGVGLIAFPNSVLHASDLVDTLAKMHDKRMYKQLVFYLEACESGSMFSGLLPNNTKVFATTAANPSQSSWGTYCPPQDVINGTHIGSCLGDLYSVNWMEDTDALPSLCDESLSQQYARVAANTTQSEVMQYGDSSFSGEPIADFLSNSTCPPSSSSSFSSVRPLVHLDSRNVKLAYLTDRLTATPVSSPLYPQYKQELEAERAWRHKVDTFFTTLVRTLDPTNEKGLMNTPATPPTHWDCLKSLNTVLYERCGVLDEYGLKYSHVGVNVCEDPSFATADVVLVITSLCAPRTTHM